MAKVYVTQYYCYFDYETASSFGTLVNLLDMGDEIYPDKVESIGKAKSKIKEVFETRGGFNPLTDYLLMSGDPVLISAAVAEVIDGMGSERLPIKILKYSNVTKKYFVVEV